MKLLIFGSQTIGGACLQALLDASPAPAEIIGVVSAPDDPPGPDAGPGSLEAVARARRLPLFPAEKADSPEFLSTVRSLAPDLLLLFDYPGHLGPELLALPARGAVNLYATLLPAYRGHAPHIRAVQHGETTTGATLHLIAPAPARPAGGSPNNLIAQQSVPILWADSSAAVQAKQATAAGQLVRQALPRWLAGQLSPTPLADASAPPFGPLERRECAIDWNRAGVPLYNLIRAVTHPYPGAYAGFRGSRCTIWRSDTRPSPTTGGLPPPGTIIKLVPFQVVTGDGLLLLRRLQLEGEPELDEAGFIARHQVAVGDRFTLWTP